ncbi:MAG: hypothetical protein ACLFT3_19285 [Cyclobacteriaceae bacterium]
MTFEANPEGINTNLNENTVQGRALFIMEGDSLTMRINLAGVPTGLMHLQHLHGKEDGSPASCPAAEADQNNDGIIDLTETEEAAGVP